MEKRARRGRGASFKRKLHERTFYTNQRAPCTRKPSKFSAERVSCADFPMPPISKAALCRLSKNVSEIKYFNLPYTDELASGFGSIFDGRPNRDVRHHRLISNFGFQSIRAMRIALGLFTANREGGPGRGPGSDRGQTRDGLCASRARARVRYADRMSIVTAAPGTICRRGRRDKVIAQKDIGLAVHNRKYSPCLEFLPPRMDGDPRTRS